MRKGEFKQAWDSFEVEEKAQNYKLDYNTVEAAVAQVIKHFGISVCDNSDMLVSNSNFHTLNLSGTYLGREPVMVICLIGIESKHGCVIKLRVKTSDETLAENLIESLA